jgi:hypothetical protein
MAKNLFNMEGHKWKNMRSKLSPTFTSGRIKGMFHLVLECAETFEKHLDNLTTNGVETNIQVNYSIFSVNSCHLFLNNFYTSFLLQDLLARYTTDVISSCAFGIKTDSMNNPNEEFRVMGRKMLRADIIKAVKTAIILFASKVETLTKLIFLYMISFDLFRLQKYFDSHFLKKMWNNIFVT